MAASVSSAMRRRCATLSDAEHEHRGDDQRQPRRPHLRQQQRDAGDTGRQHPRRMRGRASHITSAITRNALRTPGECIGPNSPDGERLGPADGRHPRPLHPVDVPERRADELVESRRRRNERGGDERGGHGGLDRGARRWRRGWQMYQPKHSGRNQLRVSSVAVDGPIEHPDRDADRRRRARRRRRRRRRRPQRGAGAGRSRPRSIGGTLSAVTRYGVSSTRLGSCQPACRSAIRRTSGVRNHSQITKLT